MSKALPNDASPAALVLSRLRSCGTVGPALEMRLAQADTRIERIAVRSSCTGGEIHRRPLFIVSGWAWRGHILPDGRRQVLNLLLPGDGFGPGLQPRCFDDIEVTPIKPLSIMDARWMLGDDGATLATDVAGAVAGMRLREEQRLLDHVVRLGRQPAFERMAHLLLELHQRLEVVGLAHNGRFDMPLTQEGLSDILGLSVVHVNRTLQQLRSAHHVTLGGGKVQIHDVQQLAALASYQLVKA